MNDRTNHVLAAIDGALAWDPGDGDAMRWTPEPQSKIRSPTMPDLTITAEQFARVTANLAPLAHAIGEAAQKIGEAHTAMARHLVAALAVPIHPCHCLCAYRHRDSMHVCDGRAAGTRRFVAPNVGTVDVTMCEPCLAVDRVPA